MNLQYNYYSQTSDSMDGTDKGSWQQPFQSANRQSQSDKIYYTGAPQSYKYDLGQASQSLSQSGVMTGGSFNSIYTNNTATQSQISSLSPSYTNESQNQSNTFMGMNNYSNSTSVSPSKLSKSYNNSSSGHYNYGYNNNNDSGGRLCLSDNMNMGMRQTGIIDMSGFSGYYDRSKSSHEQNYYDTNDSGLSGSNISFSGNKRMGNMGGPSINRYQNIDDSSIQINGNDGYDVAMRDRSSFIDNTRGECFQKESTLTDTHVDHKYDRFQTKHESSSDGSHYRERRGGFSSGYHMPYRRRESSRDLKRATPEQYRRMESYTNSTHNSAIVLNASNFNKWGFLRKLLKKGDNELAEHLLEIHDRFCQNCQERHEERKAMKRKKGTNQDKETKDQDDEEETPTELTEEEQQMRNLMGFSGFSSTKGSKVDGNVYEAISSVQQQSKDHADEITTLTDEERKMISSLGGYSVFSKKGQVEFGAPAVTMAPYETTS